MIKSTSYGVNTPKSSCGASNVIILTSGLTGSSVLTGLIARGGHWTGTSTHKKPTYDTFENGGLIELNRKLVSSTGGSENYVMEIAPEMINRIEDLYTKIDLTPYRQFVEDCNLHRPWIWKDPRLWMTIRFWKRLLPVNDCKFIILTRDYLQCWISEILRGQIKSFRYSKAYEQRIAESAVAFCKEAGLPYLHVRYEELIVTPEKTLEGLNRFLGTTLTVDDLRGIYRKGLYKMPRRSALDHVKAICIYAKNYGHRLDIGAEIRP